MFQYMSLNKYKNYYSGQPSFFLYHEVQMLRKFTISQ